MTQSAQQYFDDALNSYRSGEFDKAVTSFTLGLAIDGKNWEMRMYLAMTCARLNLIREAKQEFMSIRDLCPDPDLRRRASSAVVAMNATQTPSTSFSSIPKPKN